MLLLRMGESDREAYGGPEWLTYDSGRLDDTPCTELAAIEARTGVVLALAVEQPSTATAMRMWLWLALAQAGIDVDWDAFTPRTLQVQVRDGDPPASAPPSGARSPSTSTA